MFDSMYLHRSTAIGTFLIIIASASCVFCQTSAGHWQLVTGDPYPDSVSQVVASAGDLAYMATWDHGIYKTTDRGQNWKRINTGLNGDLAIGLLAIGHNGALCAVSASGSIYYSHDGEAWIPCSTDAIHKTYPGAMITSVTFESTDSVYIGTIGAGIFRLSLGSQPSCVQVVAPDTIPAAQHILFDTANRLIISYGGSYRIIYRLSNDFSHIEQSWTGVSGRLWRSTWGDVLVQGDYLILDSLWDLGDSLKSVYLWNPYFLADNVFGDMVVDSEGNLYAMETFSNCPWRSTDRGYTWNPLHDHAQLIGPGWVRAATAWGFLSGGFGSDEPISVSYDSGYIWKQFSKLDARTQITQITTDAQGNIQASDETYGNSSGYWSSTDNGQTWQRRMNKNYMQGLIMDDGKYYAFSPLGHGAAPVFVSGDGGMTYTKVHLPDGIDSVAPFAGASAAAFYVNRHGVLWIYYGNAHFLRSTDSGATWTEFAHFNEPGPGYCCPDSACVVGVIQIGNDIWLGTAEAIHFTSDDGKSWTVDTLHYVFDGMSEGPGHTILTYTSDEGVHWLIPGENPDSNILDGYGPATGDNIGNVVLFQIGIHYYDTEKLVRVTRPDLALQTLAYSPDTLSFSESYPQPVTLTVDSSGDIFAASRGGINTAYGLYRYVPDNSSGIVTTHQNGELSAQLLNNPVSDEIGVKFQMGRTALVTMELRDILGRSIPIQYGKYQLTQAGSHTAYIPDPNLPPGTYYLRISTDVGDVITLKLIKQ